MIHPLVREMIIPTITSNTISSFLFDMFELSATDNPLNLEWKNQDRGIKSNPGKPASCNKRVKIFGKWFV